MWLFIQKPGAAKSQSCLIATVYNGPSMPVTTKAQRGAEGAETVDGVKHQAGTIFNKMHNSAKTVGKC
jgi:hypothetical protein